MRSIGAWRPLAKALENAGGKFVSRGDEQERRLEESVKEVGHLQAQIQTLGQNMENQHAFLETSRATPAGARQKL